jgi:hypothetical protein
VLVSPSRVQETGSGTMVITGNFIVPDDTRLSHLSLNLLTNVSPINSRREMRVAIERPVKCFAEKVYVL